MIPGVCIAAALLVVVFWRSTKKQPPLDRSEIEVLRRYSDMVRREEVLPFEG